MNNSIFNTNRQENDDELTLRPKYLKDYTGQEEIKEMLNIYIQTSNEREEALDHCLLYVAHW